MKKYMEDKNYILFKLDNRKQYQDLGEESLVDPLGCVKTFVISPEMKGCGGVFRVIAGAALIGASFLLPGSSLLATAFLGIGASLALGGIAQLLTPSVKTPKGESEKEESSLFDRAASTSNLDSPIPLLVGRRIVKDIPILSSGLVTEEISLL